MKLLCFKTEDLAKYLAFELFEETTEVVITDKGTNVKNSVTGEGIFILDMTANNACLFDLDQPAPDNFSPKSHYFYPETKMWEFIPPVVLPDPTVELNNSNTTAQNNGDPVT